MADVVKAADQFRHVFTECIALEKTKGGLGAKFHSAVIMLLNENKDATGKELSKLFLETLTEVENEATAQLTEAFGPDATVKEHMPQWRQYKSDYKRGLEECARSEIMKTANVSQFKKLLNDTRTAMKEKAGGGSDDAAGDSGGKAAMPKEYGGLSADIRTRLDNAIKGLSKLSTEEAERIVSNFERATWGAANGRGGTKRGKVAGAVSSSGGAANKAVAN